MRKGLAVNLKDHIKVYNIFVALFSGNRCFLCANRSEGHETICPACLDDLPFNTTACPACAKPNAASRLCAACLNHPGSPGRSGRPGGFINKSRALFQYHYPVNHLIQCMKFRQGLELANYLGGIMGEVFFNDGSRRPDCIIPVPLHRHRLISRGYNQSVELARPLARQLKVNLDNDSCKRIRNTVPQSDLPAKKRQGNVRNAFSVAEGISYSHVLLIDDVITTGSTVNELARTLHKAGVARVDVLACAKTI